MSMTRRSWARTIPAVGVVLLGFASGGILKGDSAKDEGTQVSLCDGESRMTVGVEPGGVLPPEEAQKVADQMMQAWRRTQGEARWAAWSAESEAARASLDAAPAAAQASPARPDQPTKFTARDKMLWSLQEKKWIEEGYQDFHSWKTLGGTIGISCDMCHPDASNTHPETYPKYQVQLKKVVLLRDMINWCIENPLKGQPLPENDPRLRAVEAYILSARKGVPLAAGKH
jgi:thiosulfate dehydrogenase